MDNLLKEVNDHLGQLLTTRKNVFFIKDGEKWTIEFGLPEKEREKHNGVYLKAGEVKNYQTHFGVAMYVEAKYYGNFDIEAPGRIGAQLNWTEKVI